MEVVAPGPDGPEPGGLLRRELLPLRLVALFVPRRALDLQVDTGRDDRLAVLELQLVDDQFCVPEVRLQLVAIGGPPDHLIEDLPVGQPASVLSQSLRNPGAALVANGSAMKAHCILSGTQCHSTV